jgi:hypothetical protein
MPAIFVPEGIGGKRRLHPRALKRRFRETKACGPAPEKHCVAAMKI